MTRYLPKWKVGYGMLTWKLGQDDIHNLGLDGNAQHSYCIG